MKKKLNHNFQKGKINFCQICNSKKISQVMDFGYQPLADDLQEINSKIRSYVNYPLKIDFCEKCILLQTNYIVGDNIIYKNNYHYTPGISKQVVKYLRDFSNDIFLNYNLKKDDIVIDIGCNDGTLLNEFKLKGIKKVIGIEPTDTIKIAKKKKIITIQSFLDKKVAKRITKKYGKAKIITTTNVFAHTANLGNFMEGIKELLASDGYFVIENHYLKKVIQNNQFDTFYHEHLRTYSLRSLKKLLNYYGMSLIDAKITSRYGGNIQAHFSKKKVGMKKNAKKILSAELKFGLNKKRIYKNFFKKILEAKKKMDIFLNKNKNKNIVGKAFPARASVLINYFENMKYNIKYIFEQPSSKKLNKFVPGTDIKILSSKKLKKTRPDYVIILAWHLFDSIKTKWVNKGLKAKYVKPLPILKIF